jgi:hypothetical protein
MSLEDKTKWINIAIGVGQRKVTGKVITQPLVYPYKSLVK